MRGYLSNVYRLGVKELWSLRRDPVMLILIIYTFSLSVYTSATAMPESLNLAPIAIVDEDRSPLSQRIAQAFYPPHFLPPSMITVNDVDSGMDAGLFTFALTIPAGFQRDVLAGRAPAVQLNVDATRMSQAFTGSGYVSRIVNDEVTGFVSRYRDGASTAPVELVLRARFNPNLTEAWFGALMQIIDNVTLLSIILAGAALIREREHGTIEHLLVMPVTPLQIMVAKVWATAGVVLLAAFLSLTLVVRAALQVPIEGSIALFLLIALLHLFATTSMGIFMATVSRGMPQFALLMVLTIIPLQMLSGGSTPFESMPQFVQMVMSAAPTSHFVSASQAVLYRAAGVEAVWPQMLVITVIGALLFAFSLARFRKTISRMA